MNATTITSRPAPSRLSLRIGFLTSVVCVLAGSLAMPGLVLAGYGWGAVGVDHPAGSCALPGLQDPEPAMPQIEIPKDQKDPLFIFNQAGGFRRAPQQAPTFQVFASGKLMAMSGNSGPTEYQLTPQQVTELMDLVVNQSRLYELDSQEIEREMAKSGKLLKDQIADAPTATFSVDLPRGRHEVTVYALFMARQDYPQIEAIQRLVAIEKRCNFLVAEKVIGDRAPLVVEFVNQQIKEQGLPIEPVKLSELRAAADMAKGRFQASFERNLPIDENNRQKSLNIVYFQQDADSQPTVRVYGLQKE